MIFRFGSGWVLPEVTRQRLTRFLDSQATTHPFQYPEWAPMGSAVKTRACCAWLEEGVNVLAYARANIIYPASRLLPSHRALAVTRGPVCDDPKLMTRFLSQLVPAARELGFVYVDVSPECLAACAAEVQGWCERNEWAAAGGARASLRLDLRLEPDAIMAGFRKTTRHEIRGAERAGVSIEPAGGRDDFEDFYDLLEKMAEEKRFAPEAREDLRHVWHWIAAERGRGVLLLARIAGQLDGGALIVRAGRRAWYAWAATRKQNSYSAGHLLQWRALLWAKEAGCTEYDFGGYTVGATAGPACFKHGFCDQVVEFLPVQRCVLNEARYERCMAWTRWRGTRIGSGSMAPAGVGGHH